jgi:hypothetical protein
VERQIDDINMENYPNDYKTHYPANTSKWLLWEDPILSFLSPQYTRTSPNNNFSVGEGQVGHLDTFYLEQHYHTLAKHLHKASQKGVEDRSLNGNWRLRFPALIAEVLSRKCHLRERLVDAYRRKDFAQLLELTTKRVHPLKDSVNALWRYHSKSLVQSLLSLPHILCFGFMLFHRIYVVKQQ